MPERMRIANAQKSKVRSAVEHVFAHQKGPMGLIVRTIGIARARVKIGMANLAYNIRRFVWLGQNTRLHDPKGQKAPQVFCADRNRGTGQVVAHLAQNAAATISPSHHAYHQPRQEASNWRRPELFRYVVVALAPQIFGNPIDPKYPLPFDGFHSVTPMVIFFGVVGAALTFRRTRG